MRNKAEPVQRLNVDEVSLTDARDKSDAGDTVEGLKAALDDGSLSRS